MQIWIYLNGIQQGPYSLDQLRTLPVDASTPVWYNGLQQWTPAGQAPATAALFQEQTPSAGSTSTTAPQPTVNAAPRQGAPQKPPTFLVWNIILTILCCCLTSLAGIITGAISSSRYASGDYEGARRMSVVTEWLLIISIVWMIVSAPVSIALGLL